MRKWRPYANPRDPGVWLALTNFIPTRRGTYRTAPIFAGLGTAAAGPSTPGTTIAAAALPTVAGTSVVTVGTSTKLFTASTTNFQAGSFTDRSRGGGYTAATWSFAQYGNITLAANKTDSTQYRDSTGVGAFADLAAAPKAKILCVQSNVVLAFNINDGTDKPNSWAASNVGDYTNWSTGDAVTATPILARPGQITGAIAFRDVVVVFKRNSIYQMRYVGSPIYWQVDLINEGRGVVSNGAICNCGNFIVFSGEHGTTIYDGSSFRDVSEDFAGENGNTMQFLGDSTSSIYLPIENCVVWFINGSIGYVYNISTGSWGTFNSYKSGASSAVSGHVVMSGHAGYRTDATGSTSQSLPNKGICLVNLSDNPCVLVSNSAWTPAASILATLTSSWFGDESRFTRWKRVVPLSANVEGNSLAGTVAQLIPYTNNTAPDASSQVTGTTVVVDTTYVTPRFDLSLSSKFSRYQVGVYSGFYEIDDIRVESSPEGKE